MLTPKLEYFCTWTQLVLADLQNNESNGIVIGPLFDRKLDHNLDEMKIRAVIRRVGMPTGEEEEKRT